MPRTTKKVDEVSGVISTETSPSRLEMFRGLLQIGLGVGFALYLVLVTFGGVTYWLWGENGVKIFLVALVALVAGAFVMMVMWLGSHMAIRAGTNMANAVTRHDVMDAYGDLVRQQTQMMPQVLGFSSRQSLIAGQQARAIVGEARSMASSLQPLPPDSIEEGFVSGPRQSADEDIRL